MALSSGFFKVLKLAAGAAAVVLTLASPALAFRGGGGGFHGGGGWHGGGRGLAWRRLGRPAAGAAAVGVEVGGLPGAAAGVLAGAGAAVGVCRFTVSTLITTTAIMALPSSFAALALWSGNHYVNHCIWRRVHVHSRYGWRWTRVRDCAQ